MKFKIKSLAALLASVGGGLGVHRLYLGKRLWWLPPAVVMAMLPLLLGVKNWYQTPPFFIAMIPIVAGFIEALVIALTTDEKFDAVYNVGSERRNHSGWDAVLVAICTLLIGTALLMTTIVLAVQTYFEHTLNIPN